MTSDVFGTAALRDAVLKAWQASPARLREDANHEEDHARGYYRDRVVVELAQNAADAASRSGEAGRLLLRLTTGPRPELLAANTGTPLDADGVASLASMRASAKRASGTGVVGRFGVGFAAVRAVGDEISVLSTTGSIEFSLVRTMEALTTATGGRAAGAPRAGDGAGSAPAAGAPAGVVPSPRGHHELLAHEVTRREGSLPVLRLPFETSGRPPAGYSTAVVVGLRDHAAVHEVETLLRGIADPLLLALPGLTEIVVEIDGELVSRLADVDRRWHVVRADGEVDLAVVADRPVEERRQRHWSVTWARPRRTPVTTGATWVPVVHAPTPSDEPCTLPALLIATFPLDPSRRHVAAGALTEAVVARAAEVYGVLAAEVAAEGPPTGRPEGSVGDPSDAASDALALVPTGLAGGTVDESLRSAIVEVLRRTPMLRPAAGGELLEPDHAVAVAGPVGRDAVAVAALAQWGSGLVVLASGREAAARTVAVEIRDLAEIVEELPLGGGATTWHGLYAALEPFASEPTVREQLSALPVPLSDGRMVRGARGLVELDPEVDAGAATGVLDALGRWGLRVVDPGAAHPLLERLGVQVVDAGGLLASAQVRRAVLDCADDDDLDVVDSVTGAVLWLLREALTHGRVPAGVRSWLGLLTLRADDGEPAPAHGLVLPGSAAAEILDDRVLAPVDPDLVAQWGAVVLAAAGVREDLTVTLVPDVVADPDSLEIGGSDLEGGSDDPGVLAAQLLDGWEEYLAHLADTLGPDTYVGEIPAVADLDAVRDDAWPDVLSRLSREPELRRALLARPGGADSYTAWWLGARAGVGINRPFACTGAPDVVRRLLPAAPAVLAGADTEVQRALGGLVRLGDLDARGWELLLAGLGSPGSPGSGDEEVASDDAAPDHAPAGARPEGDEIDAAVASAVWQGLAGAALAGVDLADAVTMLPCVHGSPAGPVVRLTPVEGAAVIGSPMWWQRSDVAGLVPCPSAAAETVARALDLPLVEELADGMVDLEPGGSRDRTVPAEVRDLLGSCPPTWQEHDHLTVDGVSVDWWVEQDGAEVVVHAVRLSGLARALAQASGSWGRRHLVEVLLTDPDRRTELVMESATDDPA